jgi:hypothetical protein
MSEPRHAEKAETAPDQALATRLGFAGLVPLLALSLWLAGIPVDHVWRETTIRLLTGYCAIVLSFLGGARWALAVAGGYAETRRDIAISVVPALLAWAVMFIPPHFAFVLLAVAFAAHGAWDALSGQSGIMPGWFVRLRTQLTAVAVISMIIAFAATAAG